MDLESFIIASNDAGSAEDLYGLFQQAMRPFGYDQSVYCFLTPHKAIGIWEGLAVATDYSQDWMEHYLEQSYQHVDPMIPETMRNSRPFAWDDLPVEGRQRQVLQDAKDFNLHDGMAVPIHSVRGEVAAIGLAASQKGAKPNPHQLALIHAYAHQFHLAYTTKLESGETERITLTPKESEVLHRMAEGKTLADIGEIMCLSEDAIRYYLKSLYRKLGVNQRTQAVIKGIRHGLLNPYRIGL